MKIFALIWTIAFLLAVIPTMRFDHRLRVRRAWAELNKSVKELGEVFISLSSAANSISGFSGAFTNPLPGQVRYETDTNVVFIYDGSDWVSPTKSS